jgi:hypothetical protein
LRGDEPRPRPFTNRELADAVQAITPRYAAVADYVA